MIIKGQRQVVGLDFTDDDFRSSTVLQYVYEILLKTIISFLKNQTNLQLGRLKIIVELLIVPRQ